MTDPAHIAKNRAHWDRLSDAYQREHGEQLRQAGMGWGVWSIAESELNALGDVADRDVLEFGCGAAEWAIALAARGARCTGIDLSAQQLAHARSRVEASGRTVRLIEASAEAVPLPDASFDLIFCDHGAMTYADPQLAVPEAARLLRPGGRFVFSMATPWVEVCWNDETDGLDDRLHLPYFGLRTYETADQVSFQLPYGDWIRLFRANGLIVDDLIELQPPAGATTTYAGFARLDWARRWPAEHIWCLHKATG